MSSEIPAGSSKLATYYNEAKFYTKNRNGHKIDTITIHCYVGQVTAKQGCDGFANRDKNSAASCNYVVGYDGSIGLSVPEEHRSWCTSNGENDRRAVTIEVASESFHPYEVTSEAYDALIELVADICIRNDIKKLVWSEDANERKNHLNGCNMTVHRDYANKSCPGDYLYARHGEIAAAVNALLCPVILKKLTILQASTATISCEITLADDVHSLNSFVWSFRLSSLADSKDLKESVLNVENINTTFEISGLKPNTAYYLELLVKTAETATEPTCVGCRLVSTQPIKPKQVSNIIATLDDTLDIAKKRCTISFKEPSSWGGSSVNDKYYYVSAIINGSIKSKNKYRNENISVELSDLLGSDDLRYGDIFQIGVQACVEKDGKEFFSGDFPSCSPPVYLDPPLKPIDKLFLKQNSTFNNCILYALSSED